MHFSLWKPLSFCLALILDKQPKKSNGSGQNEIQEEFEDDGSVGKYQDDIFVSQESIPDIQESYTNFLAIYPKYKSTEKVDLLRSDEYSHISDHLPKVCLDYCGFGLFSFVQIVHYWETCSFSLTEITANLTNHVLHGGASENTMEYDIKTRIMDYMNISKNEYELVFTVSRGSAFKLLAESYPFDTNKNLLTMFDHESQSVNWMGQCAKEKGAKVQTAWFKWPTISLCSNDLRKLIMSKKRKKKKGLGTGLFVFPVQSRVTGAKYSYQWMSLAQQNNWHVLLDAGALGPKDMDSLGLSLFRPDFIITSFYRVFGYDPSGFGCLLIKKSVIGSLRNKPGHTGSGIVKISPVFSLYLSDSFNGIQENEDGNGEVPGNQPGPKLPAFSGVYNSDQVKEVFDTEMDNDKDSDFEESGSISVGEVIKSPGFSEDESSDNSLYIDLGQSPLGSDNLDSSISPVPPGWFSSTNKNKHLTSKKATSKITNSPTDLLNSQELDLSNGHHIQEIEEVTESKITTLNLESAIRRETEGEFRLLGNREGNRFLGDKEVLFLDAKVEDDDYMIDEGYESPQESSRREPEISCRHLDHVDMLGLNKTTLRLRLLVTWLVTSLLQLRIQSNDQVNTPLVHIYGPKIKLERGNSVAFNVRDKNKRLINPETVQKLAETNGISLGIGYLSHIRMEGTGDDHKSRVIRVEVVTASLGFLTNFSDVYRLWAFVAKFLNPGFINSGLSTVVEDE
uniref:uncharacterized protein LOC122609825 n=1 Tax=Erigeron canadensis TaxID=72917 RepID=UPI001CB94EC1|nr:uncharacterized protein LOC122609825 [Erigeron canadensis]